jgi:ribosome-binding factor A
MPSSRPERVGDQIRVEITGMLSRQVHDPGIGFLTVTRVEVSADLQHARVYYTTLGDDKARRESARALERASPFLRRQLAGRLRLRRAPELLFFFDESVERQDRVERILREIQQERDSAPESDERATPPPGQEAAPATPDAAAPRDPHEPADTAHHEREDPH